MRRLIRMLWVLAGLVLTCAAASAQNDDIASAFRRVSPEEETRLRAISVAPAPTSASPQQLAAHYLQKYVAVSRLNDETLQEIVLHAWILAVPTDTAPLSTLAALMRSFQRYEEAIRWRQEAIEKAATPALKSFFRSRLAADLYWAGRYAEAQQVLNDARPGLDTLAKSKT